MCRTRTGTLCSGAAIATPAAPKLPRTIARSARSPNVHPGSCHSNLARQVKDEQSQKEDHGHVVRDLVIKDIVDKRTKPGGKKEYCVAYQQIYRKEPEW